MAQRGCLSERVCVFLISRGFAAHQLTRRSWAEHAHTQKDSKSRNDLVSIISQDLWVVSMSSSRGMHCESFRTLQTCRFSQYEGFCAKFESYKLHSHHFHISLTSHILIPHLKMSPYLTSVLIMTLQSVFLLLSEIANIHPPIYTSRRTFSLPSFPFECKLAACVYSTSFSHVFLSPPL